MAALAGMLIHGLVDAPTWGVKLTFLPWVLFALITVLFNHTQVPSRRMDYAPTGTQVVSQ
jgi:hypothetical protein